jgi:glycolate oxidase FAD binding subunit
LKVLPVAPAQTTLVFELDQARAMAQLHKWGAQPLPLNASCWVRDDTAPNTPELLFVRLRGAVAAVEAATVKMTQELPGRVMDTTQATPDWTACRDQRLPFFAPPAVQDDEPMLLWRLSVPQTTSVLNLPWPQLIEWHGGQRWCWAPLSAKALLRQTAASVGGSASIFIATNETKSRATGRFEPLSSAQEAIHRRLKAEFDPGDLFNPGRMYATL